MIFQRGNPLDYERWAADPGCADWCVRALPAVLQADGDLPRRCRRVPRRERSARARTGTGDEPLVRRVLRRSARGRLRAHQRRERVPPGRLRHVRPQHPPGPAAQCRGRIPASGDEAAESHGAHARVHDEDLFDGHARRRRRVHATGGRHVERATVARSSAAAARFNSPQLLQLSGVGDADQLARARHSGRARPPRRRREHPGPPRGVHPAQCDAAGVDGADAREVAPPVDRHAVAGAARARARPTISKAGGSRAATTSVSTPT